MPSAKVVNVALVIVELLPLATVDPAVLLNPAVPKVKSPVTFPPSGSVTLALKPAGLTLITPAGERRVGTAGLLLAVIVKAYVVVRTIVPAVPVMVMV